MQLRVTYHILFHVAFDVDNECRANGDGYCRLQRVSVFPPLPFLSPSIPLLQRMEPPVSSVPPTLPLTQHKFIQRMGRYPPRLPRYDVHGWATRQFRRRLGFVGNVTFPLPFVRPSHLASLPLIPSHFSPFPSSFASCHFLYFADLTSPTPVPSQAPATSSKPSCATKLVASQHTHLFLPDPPLKT